MENFVVLINTLSHENVRHINMAKRAGGADQVQVESGQSGCGSKTNHFKRVKNGFGSIKFWVGLTRIFHINFLFLIKKTTCICHLESHVTNLLI